MKIKERTLYDGKGYVRLIDYMGGDYRVLEAARQSTGGKSGKDEVKDRALIRYLYRNLHTSVFEQTVFTFEIKIPIFIARQFLRHRTMSPNEYSGRYAKMPREFYTPKNLYLQGAKNHQKADVTIHEESSSLLEEVKDHVEKSFDLYEKMIDKGIAREQARMHLPLNIFTTIRFTINMHNLFHMLMLREHEHAQAEFIELANAMHDLINLVDNLKWSVGVFNDLQKVKWEWQELINRADKSGDIDTVMGRMQSWG